MRAEFEPAITALQKDLAELERKATETKTTINRLCELAGAPQMYADVGSSSQPTITTIRADTFYGKALQTAAREYLEMRRAQNLGPATTRDIYDAIVSGGYEFETNDPNNAMTGMRATLRKNSGMFHRLPNQSWGLVSWYEKIKAAKAGRKSASGAEDDADAESEAAEEEAETATNDKSAAA